MTNQFSKRANAVSKFVVQIAFNRAEKKVLAK